MVNYQVKFTSGQEGSLFTAYDNYGQVKVEGIMPRQKVAAIKAVRRLTGLGLKDALTEVVKWQSNTTYNLTARHQNSKDIQQALTELREIGFVVSVVADDAERLYNLLCEAAVTALQYNEIDVARGILNTIYDRYQR